MRRASRCRGRASTRRSYCQPRGSRSRSSGAARGVSAPRRSASREVGEGGERAAVVELAAALRDQALRSADPRRAARPACAAVALRSAWRCGSVRGEAEVRHHAGDRGERDHRARRRARGGSGARAAARAIGGVGERALDDRSVPSSARRAGEARRAPRRATADPARRPASLPAPRGGADVAEQRAIGGIFAAPAREPRPALGEALVDDLDDVALPSSSRTTSRRASIRWASTPRAHRQLLELAARRRDARAVGGDEAREQIAHGVLIAAREAGVDLIGVRRERAGDAAEREVRVVRDPARAARSRACPQLRRGERQQRQRRRPARDLGDHVVDDARLDGDRRPARRLDRRSGAAPRAAASRARTPRTGRGTRARSRSPSRSHRAASRRRAPARRAIGGRGERLGEPRALGGIGAQRDHLLELIDHDHERRAARCSPSSRSRATSAVGVARLSRADRRQRGERVHRMTAGPHRQDPVAARRAAAHAGVDERALADARRPEHREQRRAHEPVREALDLALAADEVVGVGGAIRGEPGIRRAIVGRIVRRVGVLGRQRREPLSRPLRRRARSPTAPRRAARGRARCATAETARAPPTAAARSPARAATAARRRCRSHRAARPRRRASGSPHTTTRSRSRRRGPCQLSAPPPRPDDELVREQRLERRERLGDGRDIARERRARCARDRDRRADRRARERHRRRRAPRRARAAAPCTRAIAARASAQPRRAVVAADHRARAARAPADRARSSAELDSASTASQRHVIATSSRSAASASTVVVAAVRCAIASAIGCGPPRSHVSRVAGSNDRHRLGRAVPDRALDRLAERERGRPAIRRARFASARTIASRERARHAARQRRRRRRAGAHRRARRARSR